LKITNNKHKRTLAGNSLGRNQAACGICCRQGGIGGGGGREVLVDRRHRAHAHICITRLASLQSIVISSLVFAAFQGQRSWGQQSWGQRSWGQRVLELMRGEGWGFGIEKRKELHGEACFFLGGGSAPEAAILLAMAVRAADLALVLAMGEAGGGLAAGSGLEGDAGAAAGAAGFFETGGMVSVHSLLDAALQTCTPALAAAAPQT